MPHFDPQQETEIENWLFERVGTENFRPGLERLRPFFEKFKSKINTLGTKVITIAGTNGKGQTALFLNAILRSSGKTTAMWSSPHILSIRERFLLNGEKVTYDRLQKTLIANEEFCQSMSYYEFLFFCFCEISLEHGPEYIILEVGLGGRFDTVNLFDADLMAIVSISRDHQEILGNRLETILQEKLGIARPHKQLFSTLDTLYLRTKIQDFCETNLIPWVDLHDKFDCFEQADYQEKNFSLAKELAQFLGHPSDGPMEHYVRGQKGRWERVTISGIRFIFIGAHNIDGLRKMTHALCKEKDFRQERKVDNLLCSFSTRPEKEIKDSINLLVKSESLFNGLILTSFDHQKALNERNLIRLLPQTGNLRFAPDWKKEICSWPKGTVSIVAGSYYFIGEVQKYLFGTHSSHQ